MCVQRTGDRPGLIALTFDDGPDPSWTPAILDILKREKCSRHVFHNRQERTILTRTCWRRIVNEGHEVGKPRLSLIRTWVKSLYALPNSS